MNGFNPQSQPMPMAQQQPIMTPLRRNQAVPTPYPLEPAMPPVWRTQPAEDVINNPQGLLDAVGRRLARDESQRNAMESNITGRDSLGRGKQIKTWDSGKFGKLKGSFL